IGQRLRELRRTLGAAQRDRVQGIGIAAPLSLGGWQTLLDMPASVAEKWQRTDLRAEVAALTEWPVELLKDTAAACVAELVGGRGDAGARPLQLGRRGADAAAAGDDRLGRARDRRRLAAAVRELRAGPGAVLEGGAVAATQPACHPVQRATPWTSARATVAAS